jgi:hypothetical protein
MNVTKLLKILGIVILVGATLYFLGYAIGQFIGGWNNPK